MRDYVAEFQKKVDEINTDSQTINIINAGIMNHGKSSLFNSLIGKEVFKEGDIRVTEKIQREQWMDNAYLIDTPGLAAEDTDDTVAYEAYRRANMIVFVHTVKVGELHEKELDAINKIKALFNDDNFFCRHFCLVLTFKESDSDESISSIRDKTLADIQQHCGISDFQIFIVSNSRYKKGTQSFIAQSGVPELREYLTRNFEKWNGENKYFRGMRIGNEKKDLISQLEQERKEVNQDISKKTDEVKKRQTEFLRKLETAVTQYNEAKSRYNQAQSQLESMKAHLADLRRR